MKALVVLIMVALLAFRCQAATITAASPSYTDVAAGYTLCSDGDTLEVPDGFATWTTNLVINKAIYFKAVNEGGVTISNALPDANLDGATDYPGYMLAINTVSNKATRMSGFIFVGNGKNRTHLTANGVMQFSGIGPPYSTDSLRVDHCTFSHLQGTCLFVHDLFGVIDHCTYTNNTRDVFVYCYNESYAGLPYSDGAWTNGSAVNGSSNFITIEDCIIGYPAPPELASSLRFMFIVDAYRGSFYRVRHCDIVRGYPEMHGTDSGGRPAGAVNLEYYKNNIYWDPDPGNNTIVANIRSGHTMIYSNTFTGGTPHIRFQAVVHRMSGPFAPWGAADGTNPWDKNTAGGPFETGTATGGGTSSLVDTNKSWTTDQWVGYSLKEVHPFTATSGGVNTVTVSGAGWTTDQWVYYEISSSSTGRHAQITGNTSTTITIDGSSYAPLDFPGGAFILSRGVQVSANTSNTLTLEGQGGKSSWPNYVFAAGMSYEIWKVDSALDMPGRYRGTLFSGLLPTPPGGWPLIYTNAIYEWGNSNGGENVNFEYGGPMLEGRDLFTDTVPAGYTEFTYPHPLVGGVDTNIPAITKINARATNNIAFSYTVSVAHGPITGYAATNLPSGLSISPTTGIISGTPITPGVSLIGLYATNSYGMGWTNIWLVTLVEPTSPYLMTTGISPNDSVYSQNLVRTLPYTYTLCTYDYQVDTNTGGTAYYDSLYALNSTNSSMLWAFFSVPTNLIATWVPSVLARYPLIWAVQPVGEETNYSILQSTTYLYSRAVTNKPLVGPSWVNDHSDAYFAQMLALGVFTNLDIISMHDYFQVPGNGGLSYPPWPEGSYYHPWEAPTGGFSNFLGRIQWMQSFTNQLRTNYPTAPKVMLTEFGLFVSNVVDATIEATNVVWSGIVVGLGVPEGPAGLTNSVPYSHGFYTYSNTIVVWSPSMLAFLGALTNPPSSGGGPGFTSGSANIGTLRTLR